MVQQRSGGKPLAPLGPAPGQHPHAADGRHPLPEAVAAFAHEPARLISPLHVSFSVPVAESLDASHPQRPCRRLVPCRAAADRTNWPQPQLLALPAVGNQGQQTRQTPILPDVRAASRILRCRGRPFTGSTAYRCRRRPRQRLRRKADPRRNGSRAVTTRDDGSSILDLGLCWRARRAKAGYEDGASPVHVDPDLVQRLRGVTGTGEGF